MRGTDASLAHPVVGPLLSVGDWCGGGSNFLGVVVVLLLWQSAPAYLRTTVVNLARTSLRRRQKEAREAQEAGAGRDAEQSELSGSGTRVDVLGALASLPQRKRECVVLRYYLDLSEAQTAQALGVSVGTVKSQTARALQQLRPLLALDEAAASRPGRGGSGSGD